MALDLAARPNAVPWPPLLYLLAIVAAVALNRLLPTADNVPLGLQTLLHVKGSITFAIGATIDIWAMVTMLRAKANIRPDRAATALVTHGPFRFTRNPIYLGNTILMIGAASAFGNMWLIPMGLLAAVAVHHLAILREEAHLAARFGDPWQRYAAITPRWIGPL